MADFKVSGLEDVEKMLSNLESDSDELTGRALYAGAGILADAVRENLENLDTLPWKAQRKNEMQILTPEQKQDLLDSLGVSHHEVKNWVTNAHVGFEGYGKRPSAKYPNGLPNPLLARSVESGTSFRKKQPFIRLAETKSKKEVIKAMQESIDQSIGERSK